jgi:hypothetical protein
MRVRSPDSRSSPDQSVAFRWRGELFGCQGVAFAVYSRVDLYGFRVDLEFSSVLYQTGVEFVRDVRSMSPTCRAVSVRCRSLLSR